MRKIFFLILFFCCVNNPVEAQISVRSISPLNSPVDEQNPLLSPDGKIMYFTRANHPENHGGKRDKGDIWISVRKDDGSWSEPVNPGWPLNNKNYNGVIAFLDENSLLLYNHYRKDGESPKTQGLSISSKEGNEWNFPEKVEIEYFYNKSDEYGISLSKDKRTMLLSLESYGSRGAEDLYVSFLMPDGVWSQPRNLGPDINTRFQEMTPYLGDDNKTLFFASNGWEGFGSRDIFVSQRQDDSWKSWSKPQNIGEKVNTNGKELSFRFISEDLAIYTGTLNSDGYGDIKIADFSPEDIDSLEMDEIADVSQPEMIDLKQVEELKDEDSGAVIYGEVKSAVTNEYVGASIRVVTREKEYNIKAQPDNGEYSVEVPTGTHRMIVEAPGYMGQQEQITVEEDGLSALEVNINLQPVEVGTIINLKNVHFYRGESKLKETSYDELDLVVKLLKENPNVEIELSGHTDNQGSARLNLKLSQKRVDKVKQYLVDHGISSNRITGKGYGGMNPIASNASEETRKLNRRVEFTIVKQ